ncbi:MAG: response regulator [Myxococcota bacterium]|nr:response regulator [Myxococcota bacterium]
MAFGTGALELREGGGTRVLVVEDNIDTADLFAALLLGRGYDVVASNDGASALRQLETFIPHIALLDIGLPRIDGYEIARRLRIASPGVRMIAITGYGQDRDRVKALDAGFEVHLLKPVGARQILDSVNALRPW